MTTLEYTNQAKNTGPGTARIPVTSMYRLSQTEPAAFSILGVFLPFKYLFKKNKNLLLIEFYPKKYIFNIDINELYVLA
jgi:hypothetical protein